MNRTFLEPRIDFATAEAAAAEAQRAIDAMATLPVNAWSDALRELAGQLQHRKT